MQFNVVSRETLLDAQKHPNSNLVVRGVARCSQHCQVTGDDTLIRRTEQGF